MKIFYLFIDKLLVVNKNKVLLIFRLTLHPFPRTVTYSMEHYSLHCHILIHRRLSDYFLMPWRRSRRHFFFFLMFSIKNLNPTKLNTSLKEIPRALRCFNILYTNICFGRPKVQTPLPFLKVFNWIQLSAKHDPIEIKPVGFAPKNKIWLRLKS